MGEGGAMKDSIVPIGCLGAVAVAIAVAIPGCSHPPPHQQGGEASAALAPPPPPQRSEVRLKQPENPEGASQLGFKERRETESPDGTVEVYEREVGTNLGGSQDFAEIVEAVMALDMFRAVLLAGVLSLCAVVAAARGWPLLAAVLGVGALGSVMLAWWAGLIAVGAGVLLVTAYHMAIAQVGGMAKPFDFTK